MSQQDPAYSSPHRVRLSPVPENGGVRPLWSVMIPTYNCARYLGQTLVSVLEQDLGPGQMQIEVVDDCSIKDDPESVVRNLGQGRVAFHRQGTNVGHIRNFETCLERSRGHLVHLLHGDDAVRPGFYQALGKAFAEQPEIGAAYSRQIIINDEGAWHSLSPIELPASGVLADMVERLVLGPMIQTPSIAVRRSVYEQLGMFDRRLSWSEDWEMWTRIASRFPIWHETQPLALYRGHLASSTGQNVNTGENVRDTARLYDILKDYLPPAKRDVLVKRGRRFAACRAIAMAESMVRAGNWKGARAQLAGGLRLSHPTELIVPLVHLVAVACKYSVASVFSSSAQKSTRGDSQS